MRARAAAIERLGCVDKGKKDAPLTISVTFVLHFFSRLLLSDFLLSVYALLAIPLFLLCARTILSFPAARAGLAASGPASTPCASSREQHHQW